MSESRTPRTDKKIKTSDVSDAFIIMRMRCREIEQESNMLLEALKQMHDCAVACGWKNAEIENAQDAIAAAEKARKEPS